jgi:selenocysteine lyase/cysteine desulfurase
VTGHIEMEAHLGGYEAADAARDDIAAAYDDVGRLVGGAARNIAIVENATVAFAQALSAFDFEAGDIILTTHNDYVSNRLMYGSLAQRLGVEVVYAEDLPEGGVDTQSMRDLIRARRPRLVAATWIPTNSGLVQPMAEVGRICAENEVPFVVDGCQAVGQIDINVADIHCDFLACTARKFLRGPRGVGFLYVSDRMLEQQRAPLFIDMRGARLLDDGSHELADDASRFENWEFAYALVRGLGAAARYALHVGVGPAGAYSAQLAAGIRERLAGIPGARVLDHGRDLAAIVTVSLEGVSADAVVTALREQAINTSATSEPGPVAVRISPHYYNTEREAGIVVDAVAGCL